MGKKSSKSRRREDPKSTVVAESPVAVAESPVAVAESPAAAAESPVAAPDVMAKASAEIAAAVPSLNQLSAEVLAAHDSFVRSPSAVVESLGIRVATAVARKLASTMPPPPSLSAKQPIEA